MTMNRKYSAPKKNTGANSSSSFENSDRFTRLVSPRKLYRHITVNRNAHAWNTVAITSNWGSNR